MGPNLFASLTAHAPIEPGLFPKSSRLCARRFGPSLTDQQAANAVLAANAFTDQSLPQPDERLPLSDGSRRHADAIQFIDGGESSEFEGIVAVGFAFDVLPLPGGSGGVGDEDVEAEFLAQVVKPAGLGAGFADNERDGLSGQFATQVGGRGADRAELGTRVSRFVPANDELYLPRSMAKSW